MPVATAQSNADQRKNNGLSTGMGGALGRANQKRGSRPMNVAEKRGHRLHRLLINELSSAGCFRRARWRTAGFGAFVLSGYAAAYFVLLSGPNMPLRALALVAAALFTMQGGFLAHEAGHGATTSNRCLAEALGQLFHTLLTAL